MPSVASLLKTEIARLSRKEVRGEVEVVRKASAQHRKHIAALRREVASLARQVSVLERKVRDRSASRPAAQEAPRFRFVAKGLRSQRERLGLSAAEFGSLVGVSAQSVYNWEHETAKPRASQVQALAALRTLGKKEALARLEQGRPAAGQTRSKRKR